MIPADGSGPARQLTQRQEGYTYALSWSRNGLVVVRDTLPRGYDLLVAQFEQLQDLEPFLFSTSVDLDASFCPDGRWIAYESNETGSAEIYVRAYPGPGRSWPISRQSGGTAPLWSRDGREIFYRNGDQMMTVPVNTLQGFTVGPPRLLFEFESASLFLRQYDASPDGQRFVMVRRTSPEPVYRQLNLVLNWSGELEQLARTDR